MIKHIVLFKMKDRSAESVEAAAQVLRNLKAKSMFSCPLRWVSMYCVRTDHSTFH